MHGEIDENFAHRRYSTVARNSARSLAAPPARRHLTVEKVPPMTLTDLRAG